MGRLVTVKPDLECQPVGLKFEQHTGEGKACNLGVLSQWDFWSQSSHILLLAAAGLFCPGALLAALDVWLKCQPVGVRFEQHTGEGKA